ncbi:MAG: ATP-binding cassette domain-containing protein [Bacteroidetes bacterium]|nr:MAG: ATP-binding cassette domain-containing protein [Bacteroidota bacterium]
MDIRVNHLTKTYGTQRAVDDISFEVKTGEILGFLGPNGAGKTTTMKILTCYMAASGGQVQIGDYDVMAQPERVKRHIGYLPENNPLYLDMPVLEYLTFVAELQGVPRAEVPTRLRSIVGRCGLNLEKHKKIGALSKGYRQRVGLAQALIHDPDILILDEPTTGLDPNQIVEIRNLIREIGKEKTVILSTHILPEVEATCDRILIINRGKIVADGTPESLRQQGEGSAIFLVQVKVPAGSPGPTEALRALPMVKAVEVLPKQPGRYRITADSDMPFRESLFRYCVKQQWLLLELTKEEQRLETIFRDLTLN